MFFATYYIELPRDELGDFNKDITIYRYRTG